MKRILYSVTFLSLFSVAQAQIFSAGFENNNGTPLSEFKILNLDGNSVPEYAEVQDFNTEGWIQFYDGYDNKIAFSTSYYDPSGQSNDWLITPKITVPSDGTPTLYWKAKSYDDYYPDSYAVMVSETTDMPEDFTPLLQTDAEQAYDFASHSFDLSAYKGKMIYLAFVNNTYDGTYLALDDLYISNSENCIMPDLSDFTISNLKPNSFSVQWSNTNGISQFDTGLTTFDIPVSSLGIISQTTKDFSNLESGKRYQFFLKNFACGSGWAGPKSIWTPSELPYSYDFEKTAENYGEYDSDGWSSYTWLNGSSETAAQSGSGYIFNNTSTSYDKNDWIFSYPVYLKAGENLEVSYYTAIGNAEADAATLKIAVATTNTTEGILKELAEEAVTSVGYMKKTAQYTAEAEGVYYIGFGNVTPVVENSTSLRIDNVEIYKSTLATSEAQNKKINVYPNPVNDILTIASAEKILKVEIYSIDGKLVATGNSESISFAGFPKGLYLAKIFTKNGVTVKKIKK